MNDENSAVTLSCWLESIYAHTEGAYKCGEFCSRNFI